MIRPIFSDITRMRRGPDAARRALVAAAAIVVLAVSAPASAQPAAGAQQDQPSVRWEDDTIHFGESVHIEPRIRAQADVILWRNNIGLIDDRFSWGSRRVGVNGELYDRVEFQIERAFQDDDDDDTAWRDVYADMRFSRAFRVRGGRFKLPFSLERTSSRDDLDFIQRATAVRALSPPRDTGVMVHGRVARRMVEYEAGVFRHAHGLAPTDDPNSWSALGATLAGRVAVEPIRNGDGATRDLRVGVALVRNTMPEGLNSVVGRLFDNDRFTERMNVNGQRTRLGAEGRWRGRRATVQGEWLQLTDQRLGQAITNGDLSDLVLRGGYLTGMVRVFGEPGGGGPSLDVAARFDRLTFGSANDTDEPFTNPRADHVAPLTKNTWTFGSNWQVHRWVRVQGNLIREALVDALDVRAIDTEPRWTAVVRLQFAM